MRAVGVRIVDVDQVGSFGNAQPGLAVGGHLTGLAEIAQVLNPAQRRMFVEAPWSCSPVALDSGRLRCSTNPSAGETRRSGRLSKFGIGQAGMGAGTDWACGATADEALDLVGYESLGLRFGATEVTLMALDAVKSVALGMQLACLLGWLLVAALRLRLTGEGVEGETLGWRMWVGLVTLVE